MYEQWCIYDMMWPQTGKTGRKNGSNDWAVTCWTLNHCWSRCGAPHFYVYLISRIVFICLIKCCYSSKKETNCVFLKISFRLCTKFLYLFKSRGLVGILRLGGPILIRNFEIFEKICIYLVNPKILGGPWPPWPPH